MYNYLKSNLKITTIPLLIVIPIMLMGLVTMSSIGGGNGVFYKQLSWIIISIFAMIAFANVNYSNLPRSSVPVVIYIFSNILLLALFILGKVTNGAQSWLHLGSISFQPADLMKLSLILLLAKYFSRRHVEIANLKHLLISGVYLVIPFVLVLKQPDFGSAVILLLIWGGVILASGASRRHVLSLILLAIISFVLAWNFSFKPYQKDRIVNFLNPLNDIRGSGYNAYQSTIAVGNGGSWGQGVGYGLQSRLNYLPEHETDFILAAYTEEWGFAGGASLMILYLLLLLYLMSSVYNAKDNHMLLFITGYSIWIYVYVIINVGMNLGVSPVTGIPLPFMSYGGTHLLFESIGLGIVYSMSMSAKGRY